MIVVQSRRFFVGVVCAMLVRGSDMCLLVVRMTYGTEFLVQLISISVLSVAG